MAENVRYILIDPTDTIVTVFLWDGESPHELEEGWRSEVQTDLYLQSPGAQLVDGEWVLPGQPEVLPGPG